MKNRFLLFIFSTVIETILSTPVWMNPACIQVQRQYQESHCCGNTTNFCQETLKLWKDSGCCWSTPVTYPSPTLPSPPATHPPPPSPVTRNKTRFYRLAQSRVKECK